MVAVLVQPTLIKPGMPLNALLAPIILMRTHTNAITARMKAIAARMRVRIPDRWKFAIPPLPLLNHLAGAMSETTQRIAATADRIWKISRNDLPVTISTVRMVSDCGWRPRRMLSSVVVG
jgi:hypothetical protein